MRLDVLVSRFGIRCNLSLQRHRKLLHLLNSTLLVIFCGLLPCSSRVRVREKVSLVKQGIRGIFCGGTEMTAQFNRFAREELVPGIDFVPTYGNTLMGLASPKPFDPADEYSITYYPPSPRARFEIVDPDDLDRTVEFGERGRVLLTTLTREFFIPRFPERDEGARAEPCDAFPWDGVSDLVLLTSLEKSVAVGVY